MSAEGCRQCETKTSASGKKKKTKLYKIIIQLHPQRRHRVYATSLVVQSCRGYPRVRAPVGFRSNICLTDRFQGKFATCLANFKWCLRHYLDQAFNPCCCASATALPFQWCRISCQGAFHSTKLGGPTIIHSILLKTTSSLHKSLIRIVRWPETQGATGVMTRSKKRSRTAVTENLLVGKEYPHRQVLPSKFPWKLIQIWNGQATISHLQIGDPIILNHSVPNQYHMQNFPPFASIVAWFMEELLWTTLCLAHALVSRQP